MAKLKKKFYGNIRPEGLIFEKRPMFDAHVRKLKGRVAITVEQYVPKRSNPQNSYWHGVIVKLLADELGYTHDEMHAALKMEFLKVRREGKPDTVGSTTELNTKDFNELKEHVQVWAKSEFDVYIPDPYEVDYE